LKRRAAAREGLSRNSAPAKYVLRRKEGTRRELAAVDRKKRANLKSWRIQYSDLMEQFNGLAILAQ
jgi:hypothetical protein